MDSNGLEVEKQQTTKPFEIASSDRQVVLRQYTSEDAEEAFVLIDRNREHLSQFGDINF